MLGVGVGMILLVAKSLQACVDEGLADHQRLGACRVTPCGPVWLEDYRSASARSRLALNSSSEIRPSS